MNIPNIQKILFSDDYDRSHLVFEILIGLLHEKGYRIFKSIHEYNDFEIYRKLV